MKKLFLSSSPSGHPLRAFFVTQSRGGVCLKSISVLFFYYELRIIFSIFSFHRSLDTIFLGIRGNVSCHAGFPGIDSPGSISLLILYRAGFKKSGSSVSDITFMEIYPFTTKTELSLHPPEASPPPGLLSFCGAE